MPMRILIASGFFPRAKSIEAVLRAGDFDVAIATNPGDCQEACRNGWADIVVLDGVGPLADARERCREIKAVEATRHLPVLLLTDGCDPHQNLFALDAGADECLSYPFDATTLLVRMRSVAQWVDLSGEWRRMESVRGAPGRDGAVHGSRRTHALVLDPDNRSRERLAEILSCEFEVSSAQDEVRALAGMAAGAYDIVLVGMDWHEVRGSRICQRIRLLEGGRHPRLLLIAEETVWRAQDLDEHGIDDVILRPVDRNEVLARMRLARRKQGVATALRTWKLPHLDNSRPVLMTRNHIAPPDRFAA